MFEKLGEHNMVQEQGLDETKQRILDTAERLFAEKGYDAVGIREITTKARCNISAINYHFGNKKNLYLEVFRRKWCSRAHRIRGEFQKNLIKHGDDSLEKVLDALARAFFEGPLSEDEKKFHAQLIMREMINPTEAIEVVVRNVMRPFIDEVVQKIMVFMPSGIRKDTMVLNLLSFMSMIIYFNFAKVPVSLITGSQYSREFKKRIIKHIVDFSIRGLGGKRQD